MAKKISWLRTIWLGRSIFLSEVIRLIFTQGPGTIKKYLRLLSRALLNESIVEYNKKAVVFFLIPPIPSKQFLNHLRLYSDKFILHRNHKVVGQAFVAVNRRCPFDCWYCSVDNTSENELSIDELAKIIEQLRKWGSSTIVFTGGEPLFRRDIDGLISRYSGEFSFVILTSGYGLDKNRALKLKSSGLFAISISLDHFDEEINDRSRGRTGAFRTALEAIRNSKEAGLYTVVQTVVSKDLLREENIKRFIEFVKNLGVDELLLLEPLNTGRLFLFDNEYITTEAQVRLKEIHKEINRKRDALKVITSTYIEDPEKFGCGAGTQHIYIDTTGEVWPCNFLPISLGNILTEPETVKQRLSNYFSKPCSGCILKTLHKDFLKFYKGQLPLSFEVVEEILKKRNNAGYSTPEFFR